QDWFNYGVVPTAGVETARPFGQRVLRPLGAMRKRCARSFLQLNISPLFLAPGGTRKLLHSDDNQLLCALWTKAIQNFKSFSLRFIVGDEEPLNLMQQVAVQISQKTNVRVVARICGDGD